MNKQDTICAIATATGGALGIIRISGDESIAVASKIFTPKGYKKAFSEIQHNTAVFGEIKNEDGSTLDEVIAVSFKAPHSYTGENSVEFSCHGSLYILNRVMQMLISEGCRLANPGEFTERAFLNGKMDLSQAEAVADLIASRSETSHRVAMNQLKGGFKDRINMLRDKLKDIQSLLELELDFSDHDDLDFAERPVLISKAEDIQKEISIYRHNIICADNNAFADIEQIGDLKQDPIEWSADYENIIDEANRKIYSLLEGHPRVMGFCFTYWHAKKQILREEYGIEWKSPEMMNPNVIFD